MQTKTAQTQITKVVKGITLEYFGTDLNSAGHYFWKLNGDLLYRSGFGFKDIPFNPESLPEKVKGVFMEKGYTEIKQFGKFTVLAIYGSCYDTRNGTRSIFFTEGEFSKEEMKALVLSVPVASKIIEKMPFEVKW